MIRFNHVVALIVLAVCFFPAGCGKSSMPEGPAESLQAISDAMASNEPAVLWDAMPGSYQEDVEMLVARFCNRMDPEIYDRGVALLNKTLDVLKNKRDFILDHPMMENPLFGPLVPEKESLRSRWGDVIDLFSVLTRSELSSLDKLEKIDIRDFIDSTGGEVMEKLSSISALTESDPFNRQFRQALSGSSFETLSMEDGKARVSIVSPEGRTEESVLVQVEGRWIPEEMAAQWSDGVAGFEKSIDRWTAETVDRRKEEIVAQMDRLESLLDRLAGAKSAADFNTVIMEFMQGR